MATLLTLFVIPALYAIVDDLTPKRLRMKKSEPLVDMPEMEPVPAD